MQDLPQLTIFPPYTLVFYFLAVLIKLNLHAQVIVSHTLVSAESVEPTWQDEE